jgi:hypothetical protein
MCIGKMEAKKLPFLRLLCFSGAFSVFFNVLRNYWGKLTLRKENFCSKNLLTFSLARGNMCFVEQMI